MVLTILLAALFVVLGFIDKIALFVLGEAPKKARRLGEFDRVKAAIYQQILRENAHLMPQEIEELAAEEVTRQQLQLELEVQKSKAARLHKLKQQYKHLSKQERLSRHGQTLAKEIHKNGGKTWILDDSGQIEYLEYQNT
jgi:cell shape-determining protein MreC